MSKLKKFGTFAGVFTPSILTILGVIMYLRLPSIVGNVGLLGTLGIILVAHIISVTTGLSVSSIATDKKVEAGGTYYMISRSLGLPIGGTLGLALFVGLSFSISLYLIGFAESFLNYWEIEGTKDNIRIAGTLILIVVTSITLISTSLAIKTQFIIMGAIVLSLVSIVIGVGHDYSPAVPIIKVPLSIKDYVIWLGIFFPAVTGFEAGVSMSGDLKDPKKSIPYGSIMAIGVGFVVYVGLAFFFSYTVTPEMLTRPEVLTEISWMPGLVVAGIWGATLSSALGSILSAPRILQATAVDRITSKVFSKGVGKANEPRNALLLTFIIAEGGILIGELNAIAEIVSIFFITTYGFLNLSCAFEARTSADFRPSFRTPVWVSLLGAVACFLVMIELNILATFGAVIILGLLFLFLKRQELSLQTGDAWSGVWASLVKTGLQRLYKKNIQTRNWRPNILMFNGADDARPYMTEMGVAIAGKLGILSAFELEKSETMLLVKAQREDKVENDIRGYFYHKHLCRDIYEGIDEIARVYGFTGVEPNTILMGWSKKEQHREKFIQLISSFQRNDYNSLFLSYHSQRKFGISKTIDVWWSGWGKNLSLAVNLLRYISSSEIWSKAVIRLLVICNDITQSEKIYTELTRIIDHFRIPMEIKIINNSIDQLSRTEVMARESAQTDLTIVGIPDTRYENLEETYQESLELTSRLGTILFINASSIFEEYSIGLDEGKLTQTPDFDQEFVLPVIQPSKYPAIADDIVKIDEHGGEVLERFFKKTFVPYFSINHDVLSELYQLSESILASMNRFGEKNAYKQMDSLYRIKRLFYKDVLVILDKYSTKGIVHQLEELEKGIIWYANQLDADIARFPKRLRIQYEREDFKINKTDSGYFKWIKLRKRILSPFSGKYISGKIKYREAARYYLRNNRHHFLMTFLEDFKLQAKIYLDKINSFVGQVDEQFEKLEKNPKGNGEVSGAFSDIILEKLNNLIKENDRLSKLFFGRLMVEFKRNVQLLSLDLERIQINDIIQEKQKGDKYFESLREANLDFSDNFSALLKQNTNKTKVGVMMKALRWWVLKEMNDFNRNFSKKIETKIETAVSSAKSILEEAPQQPDKLTHMNKVDWSIKRDVLMKDFEELEERLTEYIRVLPEEIVIPSTRDNDMDGILVPLNRISHHFLETKLLGPFHDTVELTLEKMKDVVFNINDQLSLAIFNVDNISEDDPDKNSSIKKIADKTLHRIYIQEEILETLKGEQKNLSDELIESLLTPLSIYKLPKTTDEFSHLVRDYRSKQVRSRAERIWRNLVEFFKKKVLVVLYSRSEGILLAQRLSQSHSLKSINEQTLDLVEKVSPDTTVLNQLPHYYQNLYSGRSSIGENFWITRQTEEKQMEVAIENYQSGYFGAVMILGDRNSGKTALCRHFAEQNLKSFKSYNVFAPQAGSIQVEDFRAELGKVTGINSDLTGILNALPSNTVLIIHDLELWWDRSEKGMEVVMALKKLIATYSDRMIFMINMNPFAYELINGLSDFQQCFISVIRCQPFSSIELKNLIITRHRSSGLVFSMDNKKEAGLSEIRLARLFNNYFDYADGNPGVAMSAWLNSIVKISGKTLTMTSPHSPDVDILYRLPPDWNVLLIQLILHKRMSAEKIQRVMGMEMIDINELLMVLQRAGLVKERTTGLYIINPYVESFIVKVFEEIEWL